MVDRIDAGRSRRAEILDDIVEYHIDHIQQQLDADLITPEGIPERLDSLLADELITERQADEIGEALAPIIY